MVPSNPAVVKKNALARVHAPPPSPAPPQLEVLMLAPDEAPGAAASVQQQEGEELAAHWLDRAVTAAAALYMETVRILIYSDIP